MGASGLSGGMRDLVPWPGMEPRPLHWDHRVLATEPQASSPWHYVNDLTCWRPSHPKRLWEFSLTPLLIWGPMDPWYLKVLRVYVKGSVTQSCPTLCNPIDYSPSGSSVHGILQARVLERVAISFSRGSSQLSHTSGRLFMDWATKEALEVGWGPNKPKGHAQFQVVAWFLPSLQLHTSDNLHSIIKLLNVVLGFLRFLSFAHWVRCRSECGPGVLEGPLLLHSACN